MSAVLGLPIGAVTLCAFAAQSAGTATRSPVGWAKAGAASARFRPVVDLSGLVEVDSELPVSVDAEDLNALCDARKEAVASARRKAQAGLRELGDWSDPVADERKAALHRTLAGVAAFEGNMEAAARHLESGRDALAAYPALRPRFLGLLEALGVADMRRGEIDNCLVNPGADRCLFPLRPGGHHHDAAGATAALRAIHVLPGRRSPGPRGALAPQLDLHGARPTSPGRAEGAAAPNLRLSVGSPDASRFVDVARAAGLGHMDIAGGTIVDDFDGDGLLDVVFSSVDYCSPLRLYRNRGDGTFEDRTEAAGLLSQLGGLNAIQTDYNNDGRLDIFVMRGGWEVPMRNSLLRNNGDGTFTDVTQGRGPFERRPSTHPRPGPTSTTTAGSTCSSGTS